jgi:hypothetical protein
LRRLARLSLGGAAWRARVHGVGRRAGVGVVRRGGGRRAQHAMRPNTAPTGLPALHTDTQRARTRAHARAHTWELMGQLRPSPSFRCPHTPYIAHNPFSCLSVRQSAPGPGGGGGGVGGGCGEGSGLGLGGAGGAGGCGEGEGSGEGCGPGGSGVGGAGLGSGPGAGDGEGEGSGEGEASWRRLLLPRLLAAAAAAGWWPGCASTTCLRVRVVWWDGRQASRTCCTPQQLRAAQALELSTSTRRQHTALAGDEAQHQLSRRMHAPHCTRCGRCYNGDTRRPAAACKQTRHMQAPIPRHSTHEAAPDATSSAPASSSAAAARCGMLICGGGVTLQNGAAGTSLYPLRMITVPRASMKHGDGVSGVLRASFAGGNT